MKREREVGPMVRMEVRNPDRGEVTKRAVLEETRERATASVDPKLFPGRLHEVARTSLCGCGVAAAATQDNKTHTAILHKA